METVSYRGLHYAKCTRWKI
jgi:hypothetical protein